MPDSSTITNLTPKEKPVVITSEGSKKNMFKFSFVNPKILGAMTVLLLLIGGVGAGVYLTQFRQQTTTQATLSPVDLVFQPSQIQTSSDSQFNVDIFVSANDNQITSTDLALQYNPEVLTLKSITPGQFLPKILVPPEINASSAFVSLGTDGNSGVSGRGVIATLVFEVKSGSSESSQISFDPQKTVIKVLNRPPEAASDNLGSAQVNITPATSPSPEVKIEKNTDLNGDGVVNGIDHSLFLQKSKQ